MKINAITPMSYSFSARKTENKNISSNNSLTQGVDGYSLKMNKCASEKFDIVANLSNAKVGSKFVISPKDSDKYGNIKLLISPDTKISGNGLSISVEKDSETPSFKGRVYGSIRSDVNGIDYNMQDRYIDFFQDGMNDIIKKDYLNDNASSVRNDYNFYVPTDGDGTRYKDITGLQGGVTKPASYIPASIDDQPMALIHGVLTNFARTGKTDKGFDFVKIRPAQGSAYAFLEGLKSRQIPTSKPIVFCWGDNFSDINLSRLMKKHEDADAAFSITVIPENKSKAKNLGIVKPVKLGCDKIVDFQEKSTDEDYINSCLIPELGDDMLLASVGPFIISPEALTWIREKYTESPEFFKDENKGYDFSSCVIKNVLEACNNGEIVSDKTGKPLCMRYSVKAPEETWSDLGAQKDFSSAMMNIKTGQKYIGLPAPIIESMKQNIDDKGNITFNKRTRENFDKLVSDLSLDAENVIAYCK